MSRVALQVVVLVLAGVLTREARALDGPANYVNVRGEVLSKFPAMDPTMPVGISADWGSFQSRYIAAGTRIGYSQGDPSVGQALMFGGGPQFHIPLGDRLLLIPGVNLGTRISQAGFSLAAYISVASAVRITDRIYLGVEGDTPIFLQAAQGLVLFPGAFGVNALVGFYY